MDAVALLRAQASLAEGALASQVIAAVSQEHASWRLGGSTANTIAQTVFHFYHTEDRIVHLAAQGKPTVFETGGWKEKLGLDRETVWTAGDKVVDVDQLRGYARAVAADSAAYLASTDGSDWEREVDGPRGKTTLASMLSLGLVVHKMAHMGEVAALLGCQGAKGLPF